MKLIKTQGKPLKPCSTRYSNETAVANSAWSAAGGRFEKVFLWFGSTCAIKYLTWSFTILPSKGSGFLFEFDWLDLKSCTFFCFYWNGFVSFCCQQRAGRRCARRARPSAPAASSGRWPGRPIRATSPPVRGGSSPIGRLGNQSEDVLFPFRPTGLTFRLRRRLGSAPSGRWTELVSLSLFDVFFL